MIHMAYTRDDSWFSETPYRPVMRYATAHPENNVYLYKAFRGNQVQVPGRGSVAETTILRQVAHELGIFVHKRADLQSLWIQTTEDNDGRISSALEDAGFHGIPWESAPKIPTRRRGEHHFRTKRIKQWGDTHREPFFPPTR